MKIRYMEWLLNKELFTAEGQQTVPRVGEFIAHNNRYYKVVLVTHNYSKDLHYSATVELEPFVKRDL